MEPIRIGPFLGANLRKQPKLLPPGVSTMSINQRPDRGDMRPWQDPLTVGTVSAGRKTIFMLPRDSVSDTIYWLQWTNIVHAVRSYLADDTSKRIYYSGDGAPKSTNAALAIAGAPYPTSYRDLGVPKPATAPTITQTAAGTGDDETRIYAYTYLTDWDEEGMPAISAPVTCKPGATFNITTLAAPPTGSGNNRGINRIRIYRTVAGESSTSFFFLKDVSLPATSTTDNNVTPGTDTLPSKLYAMPPSDLKCLTGLWNGIMAGITGKSVRYCEMNRPHAWPSAYETLCTDTPVALGVFEKSLVIATTGRPRLVYGEAPEAMSDSPIEFNAGCVSQRSMVSLGHGVAWATADGLAYVGNKRNAGLLTEEVMTRDDWQALNPSSIIGCQYAGMYFGFYDTGGSVYKGFVVDPDNPDGIRFLEQGYTAAFYDELEKQMYVVQTTSVRKWDAGSTYMTASDTSKVFRLPRPENPAVAEVIADAYPVTFKLYAGKHGDTGWPAGSLRHTRSVTSREPFNLPGGYLADDLQVELSGNVAIQGAAIASTIEDLKQV